MTFAFTTLFNIMSEKKKRKRAHFLRPVIGYVDIYKYTTESNIPCNELL